MDQMAFWNMVVFVSFFSFIACMAVAWWKPAVAAGIAIVCFAIFIVSALIHDNLVSNNLEELGCKYIGSGKKGQLHTSQTEYFKCPDGVIRSR